MEELKILNYSQDEIIAIANAILDQYGYYRQKFYLFTKVKKETLCNHYNETTIFRHLKGDYSIGVYAGEYCTRFVTFDVDMKDPAVVHGVVDTLVMFGLPKEKIYVSLSGKKGYHIDVFFDMYTANWKAEDLYDLLIYYGKFDPHKVEYMPRSDKAIRIPLGVHPETGNRCWYVDRDTLKPIKDLKYILNIQRVPASELDVLLETWNKKMWRDIYTEEIIGGMKIVDPDSDIDKEFETYDVSKIKINKPGTRHILMLKIAYSLRMNGARKSGIIRWLTDWYHRQNPDMINSSEGEVLHDIEEIAEDTCIKYKPRPGSVPDFVPPTVKFDKKDVQYILSAHNKTDRMVAFLIWVNSKRYRTTKMAMSTIGCIVGRNSNKTIQESINRLIKDGIVVKRRQGGDRMRRGRMLHLSNEYEMPSYRKLGEPPLESRYFDYVEVSGRLTSDTFYNAYINTLSGLCTIEYLSKFLTKPEIEDCKMAIEGKNLVPLRGGDAE